MKKLLLLLLLLIEGQAAGQTGISSDGREYFLALPYPSLARQWTPGAGRANDTHQQAFLLLASATENNVSIAYFSSGGKEEGGVTVHILPNGAKTIPLDIGRMKSTEIGEVPEYISCHVVASGPLSVQAYMTGGGGGGSYQALPLQCLGKKYVVMSYHDNSSGAGGFFNQLPSSGFAMIVAPFGATTIEITPSSTTKGGQIGYRCGTTPMPKEPPTYQVNLNRGQCYFFKSAAKDDECDLSGTTINSNKPIVVLGGHENANTDGGDLGDFVGEARDFMVEQLLPVETFDTAGYFVVPLPSSGNDGGDGDEIHAFSNGIATSNVVRIDGSSITPMTSAPFQIPVASKVGSSVPLTLRTTNKVPFAVMLYDQRTQGKSFYAAPSMMSIVPKSAWKSEYSWKVEPSEQYTIHGNYLTLICPKDLYDNKKIKVSVNGGAMVAINTAFSVKKTWQITSPDDL